MSHLILIYVSILSKALFWYRIVATEKRIRSESSATDNQTVPFVKEAPTVDREVGEVGFCSFKCSQKLCNYQYIVQISLQVFRVLSDSVTFKLKFDFCPSF